MEKRTEYAIIAAYCPPGCRELAYTAILVNARYSTNPANWDWSSTKAEFLERPRHWFRGKGGLSRARQFANLLIADAKEEGHTVLDKKFFIEIDYGQSGIHLLSRQWVRKRWVFQLAPATSIYHIISDKQVGLTE